MNQITQTQLQEAQAKCVIRQAELSEMCATFERFDLASASPEQLQIIREAVLGVFETAQASVQAEHALLEVILAPLRAAASN